MLVIIQSITDRNGVPKESEQRVIGQVRDLDLNTETVAVLMYVDGSHRHRTTSRLESVSIKSASVSGKDSIVLTTRNSIYTLCTSGAAEKMKDEADQAIEQAIKEDLDTLMQSDEKIPWSDDSFGPMFEKVIVEQYAIANQRDRQARANQRDEKVKAIVEQYDEIKASKIKIHDAEQKGYIQSGAVMMHPATGDRKIIEQGCVRRITNDTFFFIMNHEGGE